MPADLNKDGIITVPELYEYVEQTVAAKSPAVGGNQHPVMKGEMGVRCPSCGCASRETCPRSEAWSGRGLAGPGGAASAARGRTRLVLVGGRDGSEERHARLA